MVKICVIRLGSLGDTVLVTPVFRDLKVHFPDAHISFIVKTEYAPLFEHSPHLDCLIPFDDRVRHRGMAGLRRFVAEHRGERFQYFIDLHHNLRSRLICGAMRAECKLAYHSRRWQRMAMVHAKWIPAASRHTVDVYFACLGSLGVKPEDRRPEIFLAQEEIAQAHELIMALPSAGGKGFVGLHVGAKSNVKKWLPERFAEVADRLFEAGWFPLLIGGRADSSFLDEVTMSAQNHLDTLVPDSLRGVTALIDQCSLLICHDSGPMHLAVARRVPVVALFGPTHPRLGFWPLGEADAVISGMAACSPCSLHGSRPCHLRRRECMERITVDMVVDKALHILESRGQIVKAE